MIMDDYIAHPGQRIGWIHGFCWNRLRIFNFQHYKECFYTTDIPRQVVLRVMNKLEESKKFPEHIFIDAFHMAVVTLLLLSITLIAIGATEMNYNYYNSVNLIVAGSVLLQLSLNALFVEKILGCCIQKRLRRKIVALVGELNAQLISTGIVLRFPLKTKKCCFCIACCCVSRPQLSRIQFWTSKLDQQVELLEKISINQTIPS